MPYFPIVIAIVSLWLSCIHSSSGGLAGPEPGVLSIISVQELIQELTCYRCVIIYVATASQQTQKIGELSVNFIQNYS